MKLKPLTVEALTEVTNLFCDAFEKDPYYRDLLESRKATSLRDLCDTFSPSFAYCLKQDGFCYGVYEQDRLIAFILTTDFNKLYSEKDAYDAMFGIGDSEKKTQKEERLHSRLATIRDEKDKSIYCLSIAVAEDYRGRGLATLLIDKIINDYTEYDLIADVSNEDSLGIYKIRDFTIDRIDDQYYFLHRDSSANPQTYSFPKKVRLALCSEKPLEVLKTEYEKVRSVYVEGVAKKGEHFVKAEGNVESATLYELDYDDLLKYQRLIGVSDFEEYQTESFLYYVKFRGLDREDAPLEDPFGELAKDRKSEWAVVSDVYVSIPCTYSDLAKIQGKAGNARSEFVLKNLDFRMKYESGIISHKNDNYDETAIFKNRIKRVYLGSVDVWLCDENSVDHVEEYPLMGKPYPVDLYLSYDSKSECAVVGMYSLSCPFILSVFFDNIIRNQIIISVEGREENLYDYLYEKFGISKSGSPKIYSVIPKNRNCLAHEQIGSLLSGETIYSDGDNFGRIIDKDIIEAVNSELGMGQYNRGLVLAYLNVVLQFGDDQRASIRDRIYEAIITQFYIELIMFEEAAINSTDIAITKLLANPEMETPIEYLKKAEAINENYAKTICFWDIKVNYPTSQKSIDMLRNAFSLKRDLEKMERNKAQLQDVFNAKCEIVDRTDSKRMDSSLAVLAVLAIFSALIDSFDFIGAWQSFISSRVITTIQIVSSLLIIVVGLYVISHLFGNKLKNKLQRLWQAIKKPFQRKKDKK